MLEITIHLHKELRNRTTKLLVARLLRVAKQYAPADLTYSMPQPEEPDQCPSPQPSSDTLDPTFMPNRTA